MRKIIGKENKLTANLTKLRKRESGGIISLKFSLVQPKNLINIFKIKEKKEKNKKKRNKSF